MERGARVRRRRFVTLVAGACPRAEARRPSAASRWGPPPRGWRGRVGLSRPTRGGGPHAHAQAVARDTRPIFPRLHTFVPAHPRAPAEQACVARRSRVLRGPRVAWQGASARASDRAQRDPGGKRGRNADPTQRESRRKSAPGSSTGRAAVVPSPRGAHRSARSGPWVVRAAGARRARAARRRGGREDPVRRRAGGSAFAKRRAHLSFRRSALPPCLARGSEPRGPAFSSPPPAAPSLPRCLLRGPGLHERPRGARAAWRRRRARRDRLGSGAAPRVRPRQRPAHPARRPRAARALGHTPASRRCPVRGPAPREPRRGRGGERLAGNA